MRNIKIESLPPKKDGWIDRDIIMLHACFQILKDCVELENVASDYDCEFANEVRFLYDWWLKRSQTSYYDEKLHIDDDEMLMRLVKIRTTLWT